MAALIGSLRQLGGPAVARRTGDAGSMLKHLTEYPRARALVRSSPVTRAFSHTQKSCRAWIRPAVASSYARNATGILRRSKYSTSSALAVDETEETSNSSSAQDDLTQSVYLNTASKGLYQGTLPDATAASFRKDAASSSKPYMMPKPSANGAIDQATSPKLSRVRYKPVNRKQSTSKRQRVKPWLSDELDADALLDWLKARTPQTIHSVTYPTYLKNIFRARRRSPEAFRKLVNDGRLAATGIHSALAPRGHEASNILRALLDTLLKSSELASTSAYNVLLEEAYRISDLRTARVILQALEQNRYRCDKTTYALIARYGHPSFDFSQERRWKVAPETLKSYKDARNEFHGERLLRRATENVTANISLADIAFKNAPGDVLKRGSMVAEFLARTGHQEVQAAFLVAARDMISSISPQKNGQLEREKHGLTALIREWLAERSQAAAAQESPQMVSVKELATSPRETNTIMKTSVGSDRSLSPFCRVISSVLHQYDNEPMPLELLAPVIQASYLSKGQQEPPLSLQDVFVLVDQCPSVKGRLLRAILSAYIRQGDCNTLSEDLGKYTSFVAAHYPALLIDAFPAAEAIGLSLKRLKGHFGRSRMARRIVEEHLSRAGHHGISSPLGTVNWRQIMAYTFEERDLDTARWALRRVRQEMESISDPRVMVRTYPQEQYRGFDRTKSAVRRMLETAATADVTESRAERTML